MNPPAEIAVNVASPSLTVTTEDLLCSLRTSPTDLAKLVQRVDQMRSSIVAVSPAAVTRWNKDDPESWEQVRLWLTARGVRIVKTYLPAKDRVRADHAIGGGHGSSE